MNVVDQLAKDKENVAILVDLTYAFEGIASLRVSQTKARVAQSTKFFNQLWSIYKLLKVEEEFNFGRTQNYSQLIDKELFIIITAEGGFSGDIDLKLVNLMSESYQPEQHDIIVIGYHGAIQLAQRGIDYVKYFKLPVNDQNINVQPMLNEIQKYKKTTIYFQQYITLMNQEVKKIDLTEAIRTNVVAETENTISERNYIFEPNTHQVASHLERSMIQITLSQLILSSKLAQFASRFKAMNISNQLASDQKQSLTLALNRARRSLKDQRLREIVNAYARSQIGAVN
jgi:ATP synthase F1 gamma subunit